MMRFLRQQIGEELKNELAKGYDIDRISHWAFELEDKTQGERDKEVSTLINALCIMPGGPEYEYSENELNMICEMLLQGEKDPIKIIDNMRCEKNAENALDASEKLMKFPSRFVGEELKNQLKKGHDVEGIANWAYKLSNESKWEINKEVFDVLYALGFMAMDRQFEYTEEELKKLSELLISEEKDPMNALKSMRFE